MGRVQIHAVHWALSKIGPKLPNHHLLELPDHLLGTICLSFRIIPKQMSFRIICLLFKPPLPGLPAWLSWLKGHYPKPGSSLGYLVKASSLPLIASCDSSSKQRLKEGAGFRRGFGEIL
jgi:hypothetical protein